MNKPLYEFFTTDHRRVERLLDQATQGNGQIKMDYYGQFRIGLLTHIKMEELILFPAAQKANDGVPVPLAAKLRLDHGALTALMVVTPTRPMIKVLRHILATHDILEEEQGGMYEVCERLAEGETQALLEQLKNTSQIPVRPYVDTQASREMIKRAVTKAGFDHDALAK